MKLRHILGLGLATALSLSATAQSNSQKSFDKMKTLAGSWQGRVSTIPGDPDMEGTLTRVTLRVTSRGNAMVHEMKQAGTPDDPTKYDDPITMMYLDGDRLLLTHYCDAGNRPRMSGKITPDGKAVEFDFLDVSGSTEHGHMHHSTFTSLTPIITPKIGLI